MGGGCARTRGYVVIGINAGSVLVGIGVCVLGGGIGALNDPIAYTFLASVLRRKALSHGFVRSLTESQTHLLLP